MLMNMNELNDVFDEELDLETESEDVSTELIDNVDELGIFQEDIESDKINNSILDEYLISKGINNNLNVKIIDEDNNEKEINFYKLSKEDQLEILNSFSSTKNESKSPEIEKFLKTLETNKLTVDGYLKNYKDEIIKELQSQIEPTYEIDNYDDNELYLLDLKSKFDLTDEELVSELEKELLNETLFKKKVSALRADYKKLEDQYNENKKTNLIKDKEDQYNQFSEIMVDIAIKTPEFYGIELEDDDKNEVLSYLLDLDDNGVSNFSKDLNTPEKLYEAAWFLKYGKEAIDALKDAYQQEITKLKKDSTVIIKKDNKGLNNIHDLN